MSEFSYVSDWSFWIYLIILAGSTYLIRAVPFAAMQKKIDNVFIKSFLTYIPYAVLTVMTVPGIFYATNSVTTAVVGFVVAIVFALWGQSLTVVAVAACVSVFITGLFV